MKETDLKDPRERFKFLDDNSANEPHIFEVLNEIQLYQMNSLPSGEKQLATMDILKKSGKIKIPFTTTRDRAIEYLIDILLRRNRQFIRPMITFDFNVDPATRQVDIIETTEYTVHLDNKDYEKLLSLRDQKSIENLLDLLKKYRFFNLSKLMKRADEKEELSRIIKRDLDKKIFTFKNYNIDNDKIEWAEDFCFHVENYEAVKESLNLSTLKSIISMYSDFVKRGLGKFGILNADFNDYRDTKLAYIFSVLTDDLATTLSEKDLVDVKNLQSLVSCINRVDKVIDPVILVNEDIVKFVREHKIATDAEITGALTEINPSILRKWSSPENLKANKIIIFIGNEETWYIDGNSFFTMISEHNQLILYQPDKLMELPRAERRKVNSRMDILYGAAINLFKTTEKIDDYIKISSDNLHVLMKILEEYDKYKRKLATSENLVKENAEAQVKRKKRGNIFKVIIRAFAGFFLSLFKFYAKGEADEDNENRARAVHKKDLSMETRKIYNKTIDMNAPVIPLSDFVELTPENDYLVSRIIDDLREHNLKIVIPIYNARKNLYPKRSQKLLMSDIEYLMVSPGTIKNPEIIREFTDSLVGKKVKDDLIPSSAVIAIEKYLLTLYRQKKAIK